MNLGAIPMDDPIEAQVEALKRRQDLLHSHFVDLRESVLSQLKDLQKIVSAPEVRRVVEGVYAADVKRLEKLRDDCIKLLGLMRENGMVTAEEIREALNG